MNESIDFGAIRQALAELRPASSHHANIPPSVEEIYAPEGHEAALDPDRPLVVGGRGVGKSFWSGALYSKGTRELIARYYPRSGLDKCNVALGFSGTDTTQGGPPSKEIIDELITKDGFKPEIIWRAVILHGLREFIDLRLPKNWRGPTGLVAWAAEDSERLQITFRTADRYLSEQGLRLIVVFDALDKLGDDWIQIRERSKALMRVALALRSYKAIKPKIFMRVDQYDDVALFNFPDASKLTGEKVSLIWERKDLYGILFYQLANNQASSAVFKRLMKSRFGTNLDGKKRNDLPIELIHDERKQEVLFTLIAGQYMGSDPRRGKTYTWVHNHLADGFGLVSPRTFLESFRAAAQRGNHLIGKALDPKSLQYGLQIASDVRVDQLKEDYGWIRIALAPLADLGVPCQEAALFDRWESTDAIRDIQKSAERKEFLEPVEFNSGVGGMEKSLLEAMRRIGVAERRPDGRINVPDIYRVAAKLLRRGGVSPRR
ncbi:hypothetical protein SAMN02949497_0741 [Methylomagnum ishizawai]|uniref:Uncharacterized protein n=1 Tax=Methylomagnum ishizawai TaxID=1760988 RepID=A0A1Y6CS52_9GAMM|nr:hypothetical protein [Methylomagnum ishizawai]SMF93459.1 hypothetical protein SAMN02949497_0741 [Methylomagnum ishizawai]